MPVDCASQLASLQQGHMKRFSSLRAGCPSSPPNICIAPFGPTASSTSQEDAVGAGWEPSGRGHVGQAAPQPCTAPSRPAPLAG